MIIGYSSFGSIITENEVSLKKQSKAKQNTHKQTNQTSTWFRKKPKPNHQKLILQEKE